MASGIPTLHDAAAEPVEVSAPPDRTDAPTKGAQETPRAGSSEDAGQPASDLADLARRCNDLEQRLAASATAIDTLARQVGMTQQAVIEANDARRALMRELRECDERLAALEHAAGSGGKPRSLRKEIRQRDLEIESLSGYIESRRSRWEEMEALVASKTTRIDELEQELRQRVEREERAERFARKESQRASELRTQLEELSSGQDERAAGTRLETAPATTQPKEES